MDAGTDEMTNHLATRHIHNEADMSSYWSQVGRRVQKRIDCLTEVSVAGLLSAGLWLPLPLSVNTFDALALREVPCCLGLALSEITRRPRYTRPVRIIVTMNNNITL